MKNKYDSYIQYFNLHASDSFKGPTLYYIKCFVPENSLQSQEKSVQLYADV